MIVPREHNPTTTDKKPPKGPAHLVWTGIEGPRMVGPQSLQ